MLLLSFTWSWRQRDMDVACIKLQTQRKPHDLLLQSHAGHVLTAPQSCGHHACYAMAALTTASSTAPLHHQRVWISLTTGIVKAGLEDGS